MGSFFRHFRENGNTHQKQAALQRKQYEEYYASQRNENSISTTPVPLEDRNADKNSNLSQHETDRKPKNQNIPKVHPSRYNALPIGKQVSVNEAYSKF